jgi:hypothetical protein
LTTDNIFAHQSEIANAIASALRLQLTPQVAVTIVRASSKNLTAYRGYDEGRYVGVGGFYKQAT